MSFKFIIITHTDAALAGSSSEMSLWPFVETGHVDLFAWLCILSLCLCLYVCERVVLPPRDITSADTETA